MKSDDSVWIKGSYSGYWRVYGGLPKLFRSTYFWLSIVITLLSKPFWIKIKDGDLAWPNMTLSVVPSLMSFALAGMAIMLAFSSGRFLEAIRQGGKEDSYLMKVVSSFFHFALVLTMALVVAIISHVYPEQYLSAFGFFLTVYGILLTLAVVDHMWQTVRIFNKVKDNDGPRT